MKPNKIAGDLFILLFAIVTALLYSCLLPLWEGFDEPFHYAYVEHLSVTHHFPILNQTTVSLEIRKSLMLTPVSWILHRSLPQSISFEEWFALSQNDKLNRRKALANLSPELREQPSDLLNYEAQQTPLAYLLLLPIDAALSRAHLPQRIFWLRVLVATFSALFIFFTANLLFHELELETSFRRAALACIFESQMLWAAIAHVGNDSLSVPLTVAFFSCLVLLVRNPKPRYLFILAALLTAGLLAKAYFLAFVPVFAAVLIRYWYRSLISWRIALSSLAITLLAVPWYARNLLLYKSLSGTQEAVAGLGPRAAVHALFQVDWLAAAKTLPKWALWTGNWSFVSFSRTTLDVELALLVAASLLYMTAFRKITAAEQWVIFGCAMFAAGLVYQICITWARRSGQQPWYEQCILPCIWGLAFLGLQRRPKIGRPIGILMLLTTGWIAMLTYVAKLFPLYGGYRGRATLSEILHWWIGDPVKAVSDVSLGPAPLLFSLLVIFLGLLIVLTVQLVKGLIIRAA